MLNEDFDEKAFQPSSTVPLVRLLGKEPTDLNRVIGEVESSSDSGDSDLMYEFNSEPESHTSFTTKATN